VSRGRLNQKEEGGGGGPNRLGVMRNGSGITWGIIPGRTKAVGGGAGRYRNKKRKERGMSIPAKHSLAGPISLSGLLGCGRVGGREYLRVKNANKKQICPRGIAVRKCIRNENKTLKGSYSHLNWKAGSQTWGERKRKAVSGGLGLCDWKVGSGRGEGV